LIKTISNTTFTLALISLINFVLVALVSNNLGENGVAVMGLVVLGISFIVMISNLVGGSALVYLSSRKPIFSLLLVSYLWAIFSAIFMGTVLWFFELVPNQFVFWTIAIGFMECLFSIHNQIFIGKEQLKTHNSLKLTQKGVQLLTFLILGVTLQNFIISLVLSYVLSLFLSFVALKKNIRFQHRIELFTVFKTSFVYGFQIQLSNIIQLLNYRLIYFFIGKSMGGVLGIFIVAVQLAESLWIPSKALAIIQYGKVSNEKKSQKKSELTVSFIHLSFLITSVAIVILWMVPNEWILSLFGKDISGTKPIIYALSLGVMSVALSQSFSHYLSGTGQYKHLLIAALVGLAPIILFGKYAVINYQLIGAGIITSLSYTFSCIYLGIVFYKSSGIKLKDILILKTSFLETFKLLK